MDQECQGFVNRLINLSEGLAAAYREELDFWAPEQPLCIPALATIGDKVVEDFEAWDEATRQAVMSTVEDGMVSGSDYLQTAIATGLIEAVIETAEQMGVLEAILPRFGKASRSYADAWIAWGNG
jgi:hypothetical protein